MNDGTCRLYKQSPLATLHYTILLMWTTAAAYKSEHTPFLACLLISQLYSTFNILHHLFVRSLPLLPPTFSQTSRNCLVKMCHVLSPSICAESRHMADVIERQWPPTAHWLCGNEHSPAIKPNQTDRFTRLWKLLSSAEVYRVVLFCLI